MSATILIALLALIFFAQIFTLLRVERTTMYAVQAKEIATDARSAARAARDMLAELTEDGSPLMRAIDALPRKRAKKGSST